jgi:signal transduction histidine kinase
VVQASRLCLHRRDAGFRRAQSRRATPEHGLGASTTNHGHETAASDLRVLADPTAVEQILFNLVDNACKYAVDASDKSIYLRVGSSDSAVLFEVADHGPGVPADQQRKLFRPFSKSAQQAAHSAPGVGLGLALSRRLARSIGGELTYQATDGQGAVFLLSLPRDKKHS